MRVPFLDLRIQGARGMRAPLSVQIFMQLSAKILQNNRLAYAPLELAPPPRKS